MWAELLLTVAATAAFAVWQLRDLAREKRRREEARARQAGAPEPSRHDAEG